MLARSSSSVGLQWPGRNADALLAKNPRHARTVVALGRERDDPRQAAGRVEQPLHRVDIGRPGVCRRMRADVPGCSLRNGPSI